MRRQARRADRGRVRSVVVVGGGIIGLCAAYALRRGGAEVVLLERDGCGAGASSGNAGWVSPGLSAPIPGPGVMRTSLRWMLDPASPLLVRPRSDPDFWRWSWRFAASCRAKPHAAGMRATWNLASESLGALDRLREDGIAFEHRADGLLHVALDEAGIEHWITLYDAMRACGYQAAVKPMSGAEARRLEPALGDEVAGALLAEGERHVRPESLCAGLLARLRELGVDVREGTECRNLLRTASGWSAWTTSGRVEAEAAVVAAGIWSARLLAGVGVRLPLEAAKGYSVTAAGSGDAPRRPLYLSEVKVGASPFADGVRLAGTLELAGMDLTIRRRRIDAMVDGAARYLRTWRPTDTRVDWAGLRPVTPDGVPVVGQVPGQPRLFVATGHAMLGITLAAATGEALAALMLDGVAPPAIDGLGLERFTRRHGGNRGAAATPEGRTVAARGLGRAPRTS